MNLELTQRTVSAESAGVPIDVEKCLEIVFHKRHTE